jgi:mannose-1-phosphate guanylyltransferase / mannose-6-phosphate isomerase
MPITQVVLAGGLGTRLWPISREQFPKQLIGVLGARSLLQTTVQRMQGFSCQCEIATAPIVVCRSDHSHLTAEQIRASGVQARLIAEPVSRGTAPALTLAASAACSEAPDAIIVVMPADHMIDDVRAFQHAVELAVRHAENGAIATLGVPPTRPDTGFGYIRLGPTLDNGAHRIDGFVEKPTQEHAVQYVESGAYWWNSGIFVMRASVWLETLKTLQPAMYQACIEAYAKGKHDREFFHPATEPFEQAPCDSIDYAVMEHLGTNSAHAPGVVVPLGARWSDLGSWGAVWDALEKDPDGNVSRGHVLLEGVTSSYVHSEGRLVACVGMTNAVVVETEDAVLVVDRSRVQDVKGVVERIRALRGPEASAHRKVQRPWGYYDSIDHGERFQVKRIVVQPGARLSLQLHHHRAEHWTVVRGTALVDRGDEHFLLGENESTYIPLGVTHRLQNPGKLPLEIIEVQSGSYLGEDDIVRFDDMYGRS